MKHTNICYRLIVFLIANEYKRLTSFQAFIFPHLATMDRAEKKKYVAPRRLVSERPAGERLVGESNMGTARRTRRDIMAKGPKRGGNIGISSRTNACGIIIAHVRGALTARAIESLFRVLRGLHAL